MKKLWLVIAVMFMALALGTSGVMASTINYDGSHVFYLQVLRESTTTNLSPSSGNITTAFTDYADYNPSEGAAGAVGATALTMGTPLSISTSQAAGTWLIDRNTTTSYNGSTTSAGGTISHNFTALGPDPDGNLNGDIGQDNRKSGPAKTQLLHLVYTTPAAGTYRVSFQDTYSSTASVNQGTGSSFPVSWFEGYSLMGVAITAGLNFSNNGQLLYDKTVGTQGSSTPIAGFSDIKTNETFNLGDFSYLMAAGQTITLDAYLTSYYNAETTTNPIPLPSTMLLLGSGLVGLGLLRGRKWSLKK